MRDYMLGFDDLIPICDDTVTEFTASHVFRGGLDICKEMFGEEDDECIIHNLTKEFEDKDFQPGA